MARPRPLVPPTTANLFDDRSSRSIGIGRMVRLGSGTPLMEVFCFRRDWELTAEFFEAFTDVSFLVCVGAGGVSLDELPGVDGKAGAGDVTGVVGTEEQHGMGSALSLWNTGSISSRVMSPG